jgi:hypothetical protein
MRIFLNTASLIPAYAQFAIQPASIFSNQLMMLGYALGFTDETLPFVQMMTVLNPTTPYVAILTPVFSKVSHNDAFFVQYGRELALNDNERDKLLDIIQDVLSVTGLVANWFDEDFIALKGESISLATLYTDSIITMLNKSLYQSNFSKHTQGDWLLRLTEIQMAFQLHPISNANGVWVWQDKQVNNSIANRCVYVDDETSISPLKAMGFDVKLVYHDDSYQEDDSILLLKDNMIEIFDSISSRHQHMPIQLFTLNASYHFLPVPWYRRFWRQLWK